jgi:hypothetical protein
MNMTIDEIIFAIVMITVIGIVLWDMNKDKENEPGE